MSWNGRRWRVETPGSPGDTLAAVSCSSTRVCLAVGGGYGGLVAERWNGSRWVGERPPPNALSGEAFADFSGVSCLRSRVCAAVGQDDVGVCWQEDTDSPVTLVGFWRGGPWSLARRPNLACAPAGSALPSEALTAVACSSSQACTAVGSAVPDGGTFAELDRALGRFGMERHDATVAGRERPPGSRVHSKVGLCCRRRA